MKNIVDRRRNVPSSHVGCYRVSSGCWIGVVMCADTCLYRTKKYKHKVEAYGDALAKRKALELDIDERCHGDSHDDQEAD